MIKIKLHFDLYLIKKDNCPKVNFHLISKILKRTEIVIIWGKLYAGVEILFVKIKYTFFSAYN